MQFSIRRLTFEIKSDAMTEKAEAAINRLTALIQEWDNDATQSKKIDSLIGIVERWSVQAESKFKDYKRLQSARRTLNSSIVVLGRVGLSTEAVEAELANIDKALSELDYTPQKRQRKKRT